MSKSSKTLSYILILALLVTALPANIYASAAVSPSKGQSSAFDSSNHPQLNKNVGKIIGELTEKREANVKHFLKDDNTIEAAIYPYPVHYKENGQWKDMDNSLVEEEDGETSGSKVLANKNNDFHVKIAKDSTANKLVRINKGKYEIAWNMDRIKSSSSVVTTPDDMQINAAAEQVADTKLAASNLRSSDSRKKTLVENERKKILPKTVTKVDFADISPSTDLQYIIESSQVKENIVLKQKVDNPQMNFNLSTKNLIPVYNKDNSIIFYDAADTQKAVMQMMKPIMFDANGSYSEAIELRLDKTEAGYKLTISPDTQWLNASERVYPVTIDPPIETSLEPKDIYDTDVQGNRPYENSYNYDRFRVGKGSISGTTRSFLRFKMPPLASSDMVINATMGLALYTTNTATRQINAHKVLEYWEPKTITWANQPAYDTKVADYQMVTGDAGTAFYWDITGMVKEWYSSGNEFGVMLKNADESVGYNEFVSSDNGSLLINFRPRIMITYVNNSGLENYWTYHSQNAGRAGTGYVNDYNGNVIFIHEDTGMDGNRMPVSIRHIFNSNEKGNNIGLGNGWRTNLNQTVTSQNFSDGLKYIYTDEDGTKHYFKADSSGIYKDESGTDLTLTKNADGTYIIKDKSDNKLTFNSAGYLSTIVDRNGNTQTINYIDTSYISTVTDGSGRVTRLDYANNLLSQVTDPAGRITKYFYTDGKLTKITYPDTNSSDYSYEWDGNISAAANYDGYKVGFEYGSGNVRRATKIKEFHTDGTLGNQLELSYGYNTTTFTDVKGNKNIYQFNDSGNTVYIKDNLGYAKYFDYAKDSNINKLSFDSKVQKISMNLLKNHNAEVMNDAWASGAWSGSTGTGTFAGNEKYFGNTSLKVEKTNTMARYHFYQPVTVEKGKTYTFSSYVKRSGISNVNGKGAFIFVGAKDSANNSLYFESEKVSGTADWERLEVTFTVPSDSASNTVNVAAGITEETGTAYFDALQLEEGSLANRYNLVENADFAYGLTYWNKVGTDANDTVVTQSDATSPQGLDANRMKFTGNAAANKWLYQDIKVSGNKDDVFVLSGWGKGQSVPLTYPRWFAIDLQFNYTDGSQFWYTFNLNEDSTQWQYASHKAIAQKPYNSVTVIYRYYLNQNEAYFDGLQLFKEEFGQSYQYDEKGNVLSTEDLNKQKSSFEYDSQNDLIKAVDPKGGVFRYSYDDKHNIKSASTAENVMYSLNYDTNGNPVEGKIGDPANKYSDANNYYDGNRFFILDVTGDKKDDLVTRDVDGNLNIWKSSGTKLEDYKKITGTGLEDKNGVNSGNYFLVMDFNGDGKDDLVTRTVWGQFDVWLSDGTTLTKTYAIGIGELSNDQGYGTGYRFFVMDVNGDSKDDLVSRSSAGIFGIYTSTGTTFTKINSVDISLLSDGNGFNTENRFFVMDMNGDGKDDLVVRGGSGTFIVYQSNGSSLIETSRRLVSELSDADGWNTGNRFVLLDMDNDGKEELLSRYSWGQFGIWKSDGTNLITSGTSYGDADYTDALGWNTGHRFLAMDINGDHKDDLIARYADGSFVYHMSTGTTFQRQGGILSPAQITASAKYTASGQYISELTDTFGQKEKYEYDETYNRLTKTIDVNQKETIYSYDILNRLTKTESTVNGQTVSVENTYDKDRLTSMTKNGSGYFYGYDSLGNNTTVSVGNAANSVLLTRNNYETYNGVYSTGILKDSEYQNGQKVGFTYDSLYRMIAKTANGVDKFRYEYDNTGNLGYKKDLVNNVDFRYIYDLANRLIQVKDTRGNQVKYEYDANNNINKVSENLGGTKYDTAYTYDKDNKLKVITYGSSTKTYNYDTLARLVNMEVKTGTGYKYNTAFTYAPGVNGATSSRIKTMENDGKVITYTYNAAGNIETITQNGQEIRYTYNALNEVVREDNAVQNKTILYGYDLSGNILSKTEYPYTTGTVGTATSSISYSYGDAVWKDKLTSYAGKAITYDAMGNPTQYDGYTFTWEMGRQLASMTGNGKNLAYKYNDSGIRTEKTFNGVTTKYTLEGDKVIYETNGIDKIHYTYSRNGSLISMNFNGTEYYYIKNVQGDIIGLYDGNGSEVVTYSYDTWGKLVSVTGTLKDTLGAKNPYRYKGYRYDTETGLYYLNSRYYNPDWGRFINADAIVTFNVFAYADNNPVNMVDSDGFKAEFDTPEQEAEYYEWKQASKGDSKGFIQALGDFYKEKHTSPYSAVNYWSGGMLDMIGGAFNPDKPMSLEHWADSAGVVLLVLPVGELLSGVGNTMARSILGAVDDGARVGIGEVNLQLFASNTTNAVAEAKRLGFQKTNYRSHGQAVFKKGRMYITPDVDGHNGGVWKAAGSVKDLGSKSTRWGTYDANLNRIGD